MILKGRARKDFIEWCEKNYSLLIEGCGGFTEFWGGLPTIAEYVIIQEWLDKEGIKTYVRGLVGGGHYPFGTELQVNNDAKLIYGGIPNFHETRAEALKSVIKKANEIYNTRSEAIACCSNSLNKE